MLTIIVKALYLTLQGKYKFKIQNILVDIPGIFGVYI